MTGASFSFSGRLLSSSCYLGVAPLVGICRRRSSNPLLDHHKAQALAVLFVLLVLFLALCLFDASECGLQIKFPALTQRLIDHGESFIMFLNYGLLVTAGLVGLRWAGLIALALRGSLREVPILARLTKKRWVIRSAFFVNSLVLCLVPLTIAFAIWATSMTRRSANGAAVYFLYDEGIGVPRWGYALGLARISLQARQRWGKESVVLDSLDQDTLRTALANANVLILATHGGEGYATTWYSRDVLRIGPPEDGAMENNNPHFLRLSVLGQDDNWSAPENLPVNDHLALAYLFACDAGVKAAQWNEHLAPAKVITYNRPSTVLDHAVWFAFTGPAQLARPK